MTKEEPEFKVNQKIVYPSQGVGKIVEIKERVFKEQTLLYYVIYLDVSDMTVMIPVERCKELGVRAIVSKEEAQAALDMMGQEFEPVTSDWKQRYQANLDLLKKGTVSDIATIVRCLYHRSKIKELPILERKLYDSATKLLEDEIALALDLTPKEIEAMIHARLEPLGIIRNEKASSITDDDDFDEDADEFMDDAADDKDIDDGDDEDEGDED
ncbi:MAG: CarD family transcriptional regulator [Treponemataceae bacterium]|nr:CarD family transcriptional regulator [Treponemataceae bacterium]